MRKEGYYWVKLSGYEDWIIEYWREDDEEWSLPESCFERVVEVDERRIERGE